jgi:hypothetical protein
MTRNEWVDIGYKRGWLSVVCFTHDEQPQLTALEAEAFEIADDPCVHRFVVTPADKMQS